MDTFMKNFPQINGLFSIFASTLLQQREIFLNDN